MCPDTLSIIIISNVTFKKLGRGQVTSSICHYFRNFISNDMIYSLALNYKMNCDFHIKLSIEMYSVYVSNQQKHGRNIASK